MSHQRDDHAQTTCLTTSTTLSPPGRHTCASLLRVHGRASRESIASFIWGVPTASLLELGGSVSSERVIGDGLRILGALTDLQETATDAQCRLLGVGAEHRSALASCLDAIDERAERDARRTHTLNARRVAAKRTSADELSAGRKRREPFKAKALQQAGGSPAWNERIRHTCGAVETLADLATSLEALGVVGLEMLDDARALNGRIVLDDLYFRELSEAAAALREAHAKVEGAEVNASAAAVERNWSRGAACELMQQMVRASRAANEVDPTIPKLSFRRLKSVMQPTAKKKKKGDATPKATQGKAGQEKAASDPTTTTRATESAPAKDVAPAPR